MRQYVLVLTLVTGCVKANLVECSDGTLCPSGTTCDVAGSTCIDPHGLSVPVGDINLGSVSCGETSGQIALPISNYGVAGIEAQLGSTVVGVTVTPGEATIEAHGTLQALVTARGADDAPPGTPIEGAVVIITRHEQVSRAIRFDTAGAVAVADNVDFGETFSGTNNTEMVRVHNGGNLPFTVAARLANNPSGLFSLVTTSAPLAVQPGTDQTFMVKFDPGAGNVGNYTAKIALDYVGPMCHGPTAELEVNGSASGDVVIVDHSKLDFGNALCGAPAQDIVLTMTNRSMTAQTVTLTLMGSHAAKYAAPSSVVIPGGTSMIAVSGSATITRLPIPTKSELMLQPAQLKVDFKEAGIVKTLDVGSAISAPVLSTEISEIDFGTVGKGGVVSRAVRVHNLGTQTGTVTVSPTTVMGPGGAKLTVSPTVFQIPRNGVVPVVFTFTSGGIAGVLPEATFTLSSPGQCSTPPAIKVAGATSAQPAEEIVEEIAEP